MPLDLKMTLPSSPVQLVTNVEKALSDFRSAVEKQHLVLLLHPTPQNKTNFFAIVKNLQWMTRFVKSHMLPNKTKFTSGRKR
jgi:hypothetical protein